jgi:hypothetical protein
MRLQVEEIDHSLRRFAVLDLEGEHPGQEEQFLDEARAGVRVTAEEQVLQHRRVLEQLDVLEGARDAPPGDLVGRHPRDVPLAEEQPSVARIVDPAHQVEDGGLAGAVGADDGEHLALIHLEAHAVERPDAPEVDAEAVRLEERHRRRSDLMYAFWRLKVARL